MLHNFGVRLGACCIHNATDESALNIWFKVIFMRPDGLGCVIWHLVVVPRRLDALHLLQSAAVTSSEAISTVGQIQSIGHCIPCFTGIYLQCGTAEHWHISHIHTCYHVKEQAIPALCGRYCQFPTSSPLVFGCVRSFVCWNSNHNLLL